MYVCVCHAVTDADLDATIDAGARTEQQVAERCGAGTGCGMCIEKICARLGEHAAACPRVQGGLSRLAS